MQLLEELYKKLVEERDKVRLSTGSTLVSHDFFCHNVGIGDGLNRAAEIVEEFERKIRGLDQEDEV